MFHKNLEFLSANKNIILSPHLSIVLETVRYDTARLLVDDPTIVIFEHYGKKCTGPNGFAPVA